MSCEATEKDMHKFWGKKRNQVCIFVQFYNNSSNNCK